MRVRKMRKDQNTVQKMRRRRKRQMEKGKPIGTAQVSLYLSLLQECLTDAWVTGSSGSVLILSAWRPWNNIGQDFIKFHIQNRNDSVWTACKLWSKHCHSHITFVNLLYTSQHLVTFSSVLQMFTTIPWHHSCGTSENSASSDNLSMCVPWSLIKQCFNFRVRSQCYHLNTWLLA